MSGSISKRVDPRALLRVADDGRRTGDARRAVGIAALAAVCLTAFGGLVVRANDDTGVLAFVREQSRTVSAARQTLESAGGSRLRQLFPPNWGRKPQGGAEAHAHQQRPSIATAFAPVVAIAAPARMSGAAPLDRRLSATPPRPLVTAASPIRRGDAVAYCVRACDGFFFPLGPSHGSEAADAAACNNLCPAAETRLYTRRVGDEMDDGRSRKDGRRYAQLPAAFKHRSTYDPACSCTGAGRGLATNLSASRDATLRAGDAVMTNAGMMVFNGGRAPHQATSFTAVDRSALLDADTRSALRRLEQASLPGRSGVSPGKPTAKRASSSAQLASADGVHEQGYLVRYVGPYGVQIR